MFFILLTIILQVLDWCTHKLKVSYFSADLLFFLAVASKGRALTVYIRRYYIMLSLESLSSLDMILDKGGTAQSSPCFHAHTGTTVGKIARCC
jgi:hypothetical protein